MEAFLQFAGLAGGPTSIIGFLLFLYFTVRKQEAVVQTGRLEEIERLKTDNETLRTRLEAEEKELEELRQAAYLSESEHRKICAEKELQITELKMELLRLGWKEEDDSQRNSSTDS